MRVFSKKIGNLILTLPGLPWPFSLISATVKTSRIYTSMDPVCAKRQDFLQCGYLSREHIFYKLIKNAVDFVTAVNNDFSKENQYEWDSEILDFLDSINTMVMKPPSIYLEVLAFTNGQLLMQSKLLLCPNATASLGIGLCKEEQLARSETREGTQLELVCTGH